MKQMNCGSCECHWCTRQCLQKRNSIRTSKSNHNLCNRFLCKGETSYTELIILNLRKGKNDRRFEQSIMLHLYNRRLYVLYCFHNLTAWHCLSVSLLQAVISTVIFSPSSLNIIGRARRVQIKNVVLLCCCPFTPKTNISIKRLSSAGVFIACESCFNMRNIPHYYYTPH